MKRIDLLKKAKAAGYELVEGGSHTKVLKDGVVKELIPRHKEVNEYTARAIMRNLGLK